eukprot:3205627-Karenia_brevis.AAC.1
MEVGWGSWVEESARRAPASRKPLPATSLQLPGPSSEDPDLLGRRASDPRPVLDPYHLMGLGQ